MLTRPLGRPKNRWEDDIRNDMKKLKIQNWTSRIHDRNEGKLYVERGKTFKEWSCSAWRRRIYPQKEKWLPSMSNGWRDQTNLTYACTYKTHGMYILPPIGDYIRLTYDVKGLFTHSMQCPCRADKGLECVFPIWFTQCGCAWFTLAMPRPCHGLSVPFFSRPRHVQSYMLRWFGLSVVNCRSFNANLKVVLNGDTIVRLYTQTANCKTNTFVSKY